MPVLDMYSGIFLNICVMVQLIEEMVQLYASKRFAKRTVSPFTLNDVFRILNYDIQATRTICGSLKRHLLSCKLCIQLFV